MATLYDIDERITALVDEETGEIADIEALEALQGERTDKLENIALWIKNLTSDAAAYKAEKQAFEEKQKAAERKAESLKAYLAKALAGEKLKTARVTCSYRISKSVKVDDVYALPDAYLKYSEPTADKATIKRDLEAGIAINGAEIVENTNLIIK